MSNDNIIIAAENENLNTRLLKLGFWASVLFVLVAAFSQLVFGLIISVFVLLFRNHQFELVLLAALFANVFSLLLFYLFFTIRKYDLKDVFQISPYKIGIILPVLLVGLTLQISGSELDNLVRTILPPSALDDLLRKIHPEFAMFERLIESMGQMLLLRSAFGITILVLSACIVAPVFEELLFRGIIFTGLRRKFPFGVALFIQAFLFGLMHGNPWQFVYAFILGFLLGLLVKWSQSIFPAIILHVIINSSAVIFNKFFTIKGVVQIEKIEHVNPWLLIVSIVISIFSILWIYKLREKNQEDVVAVKEQG